jgi:hypothetical protein
VEDKIKKILEIDLSIIEQRVAASIIKGDYLTKEVTGKRISKPNIQYIKPKLVEESDE